MPFEYGMPSDEFGPDSATLSPTFRSAAHALTLNAAVKATAVAHRMKVFMSRISW